MNVETQEEMREQNKKDVNNFKMRHKVKATEILAKQKAAQTLTDAIRAKKARIQVINYEMKRNDKRKLRTMFQVFSIVHY